MIFKVSLAQFGFNQEEILSFKSYQSFERIHVGGEIKLAFRTKILDEWHINSNKPNEDFLIPTELKLTSAGDLQFDEIIYPKAHDIKLDISDTPVSVYEGEIYFGTKVKIPNDIEVGIQKVFVDFTYQGCNNVTCMAPVTLKDTLIIEVVDRSQQIEEINGGVFSNVNLEYDSIEQKEEEDPSIALQTRATALLEKISNVELSYGPFDLNPGVRINDVRKFVEVQKHILERILPNKIEFRAALDRLEGFWDKIST